MIDTIAVFLERNVLDNSSKTEAVVEPINKDGGWLNDKIVSDFLSYFENTQSPFLSSLITEDSFQLPANISTRIQNITDELGYSKNVAEDIEKLVTKLYITNSKENINFSKSTEGEFTYFTYKNGTYKNLLIDEDGDIEILVIPTNKKNTYSKRFYKEDGLNFSKVVRTFNELH